MLEKNIFYKHDVRLNTFWNMMVDIEQIGHYFQHMQMNQTGYDRYSIYISHDNFTIEQLEILKNYGFHKKEASKKGE